MKQCQDEDPFKVVLNLARSIGEMEERIFGPKYSSEVADYGPRDRELRKTQYNFTRQGYYFAPQAGQYLQQEAEIISSRLKQFLSNFLTPDGPNRYEIFLTSDGSAFLAKSLLNNIFGNIPICMQFQRLCALLEKLSPIFQDET
jgi:hypothetical protein